MIRRPLPIPCEGATLAATLDLPDGQPATTGLLIITGGNEIRSGAWTGQAQLAARLAAAGHAVLRFDRRGVGDSEGENTGFTASAPDITAALTAFRAACPDLTRIVAWGNCDAASALMLGSGLGADGLILSNPWTFEISGEDSGQAENTPAPPQALRAYYLQRLANPVALLRLLKGKISLGGLVKSLIAALRPAPPPTSLAQDMAEGLARFPGPARILLASRDRTAQAFLASWAKNDPRLAQCPGASHSFVEESAREWLFGEILEGLKE